MNHPGPGQRFSRLAGASGSLRRQLVQGAGLSVVLQGLSLVLSFGTGILAARLLGPLGLGKYAYALAVVGALSIPAALGLPTALVRFLAVYRENKDWDLARGLLQQSNVVTGALCISLALVVALMAWIISDRSGTHTFWYAAPLIPLLVWTNLRQKALQGLHHPVASQLPEQFVKPLAFLFLGGGLWLTDSPFRQRPQVVMAAWLLASGLAFLVGVLLLRRFSPAAMRAAKPRYAVREWLGAALPLLAADAAGVVYSATDIILLGVFRPAAEVGLYQVAVRTAALLVVFSTASNWVLAPWFARLHTKVENVRLQRIVTRTTRVVSLLSALAFILFVVDGRELLGLFFGDEFRGAWVVLLILGGARLIDVASGPVVNLMAMTGGQTGLAWTVGAAAVANALGCWLLIPRFGMYGAASSTALAIVAMNLTLAKALRRRIGIHTTVIG